MATTSVYGLRYQALTDSPHGPNLGQNLAEDVEDELVRIDAALAADNMVSARVDTSDGGIGTSYTDLPSAGPAVTLTTGTSVEVVLGCALVNTGASLHSYMGFVVSGASTLAADDSRALFHGGTLEEHVSLVVPVTGLTPGSNTFTAKYKTNGGTGTWRFRTIHVRPA